jgi:hypothetical protein
MPYKYTEARRKARLNYDARMRNKGLRKFTIWLPEEKLSKLRGNTSIQEFVENLLNQQSLKE